MKNVDFISTRRFGDATVSIISLGDTWGDLGFGVPVDELRSVAPDVREVGEAQIGQLCAYVSIGDASILIDPGLDDPDSESTQLFLEALPGSQLTPGLTAALDELGVKPDEVTHVLITHAHFDHVLGLVAGHEDTDPLQPRFPNARHYMGRAEPVSFTPHDQVEFGPDPPHEFFNVNQFAQADLEVIRRHDLFKFIEGEGEIVPGLTMIPAPGESAGHYVVRLDSAGEIFYFLGDLVHHAAEVARPAWIMGGGSRRDVTAMRASRDLIYPRIVEENAIAVFAHGVYPGWGRIVSENGGFRWRYLESE